MVLKHTKFVFLAISLLIVGCKKSAPIPTESATNTTPVPINVFDTPGGTNGGVTAGGSSTGFYDYGTGTTTGGGTVGGGTVGGGTTTGGVTTGGDQNHPDPHIQQVRECNNTGKIYQRSQTLCNSAWTKSATFPCTQVGIIAEFAKKNWTISESHFAGYVPDQCGYDQNNNPVALLVNPDYTMERVFSI